MRGVTTCSWRTTPGRRWHWCAAWAARSTTPTAASISTSSPASRSACSATRTRRSSRRSPVSSRPWATPATSTRPSRRSALPKGCWDCWAVRVHGGRIFFCNSGAEANETAIKIARRTGRTEIIAAEGSFHGRTMGALSITGQPAKRAPFEPLLPGVRFVPYGDGEALTGGGQQRDRSGLPRADPRARAGWSPPPAGYLQAAGRSCDAIRRAARHGRGAERRPYRHLVRPPAGRESCPTSSPSRRAWPAACRSARASVSVRAADLLQPGDHGSTFGGNPVVCAAALAVIDVIESEGLIAQAADGRRAACRPACRRAGRRSLTGVRGQRAVARDDPGRAGRRGSRARVSRRRLPASTPSRPTRLRLAPPLVLTCRSGRFVAAVPKLSWRRPREIAKVTP